MYPVASSPAPNIWLYTQIKNILLKKKQQKNKKKQTLRVFAIQALQTLQTLRVRLGPLQTRLNGKSVWTKVFRFSFPSHLATEELMVYKTFSQRKQKASRS